MTTTTPVLQFGACPRCEGPLAFHDDIYGPYWSCLPCGYHAEAGGFKVARTPRVEAVKGYNSVFDYCGPEKTFKRVRIRGRLLSGKESQTFARFDLTCPYRGCSRRQLMAGRNRRGDYECKNRHRIRLNVNELTWR